MFIRYRRSRKNSATSCCSSEKSARLTLADLGMDFPIPIFPIFFLFFLLLLCTNVLTFTHLWLPKLILAWVSPSIFLWLLLYPFTHYYPSLITLADLGMGFPQPRISFCACSRTRSPLGDNVGRIQIQCWKDTNTMLEGYKYNVGRIQIQKYHRRWR